MVGSWQGFLDYTMKLHDIPSLKVTQPLKIGLAKMNIVFQPAFFSRYTLVSRSVYIIYKHNICIERDICCIDPQALPHGPPPEPRAKQKPAGYLKH